MHEDLLCRQSSLQVILAALKDLSFLLYANIAISAFFLKKTPANSKELK